MSSLVMGVIKEIRAQQSLVGDEANLRRPTVLLDNGAAIAIGEELGSQAARSLLDELRDKNVPIAFRMGEIGATEVFIVQRWVVKEILDEDATGVAVEFLISHARHVLPRENPDFDRIMDELRRSHQLGDSVMVAEDDGHHILEVWRSGA